MTGGIGEMRNILYDSELGLDLPQGVQIRRLRRVMDQELTPRQRETVVLYYFEEKRMAEIARIQGVHRSTVLRTLRRAEDRLRRYLRY